MHLASLMSILLSLAVSEPSAAPLRQQLSLSDCGREESLQSQVSDEKTSILFVNNTKSEVQAFWLDFQGKRKEYFQLKPGKEYLQPTFVSHPWLIVSATGKRCLGIVEPVKEDGTVELRDERRDESK